MGVKPDATIIIVSIIKRTVILIKQFQFFCLGCLLFKQQSTEYLCFKNLSFLVK